MQSTHFSRVDSRNSSPRRQFSRNRTNDEMLSTEELDRNGRYGCGNGSSNFAHRPKSRDSEYPAGSRNTNICETRNDYSKNIRTCDTVIGYTELCDRLHELSVTNQYYENSLSLCSSKMESVSVADSRNKSVPMKSIFVMEDMRTKCQTQETSSVTTITMNSLSWKNVRTALGGFYNRYLAVIAFEKSLRLDYAHNSNVLESKKVYLHTIYGGYHLLSFLGNGLKAAEEAIDRMKTDLNQRRISGYSVMFDY